MAKNLVVLAEDDQALLRALTDLLQIADFEVIAASDGAGALSRLQGLSRRPDIIVSDIGMPNMDGYEFLAAVRERPEWMTIPFIFLTARGEKQDIRDGKLRGADDYVVKPFEFPDLLASIQSALQRRAEIGALQASEMETLRQQILKVLNHEFRTPLIFVEAYADLMASSPEFTHSEELRRYIRGIVEGSERLSRLIESFLVLAELESGSGEKIYEYRKRVIEDVDVLVTEIVTSERARAETRGVELRLMINSDLPAIQGDWTYLTHTIRHLIDNAIKFSPEDSGAAVNIMLQADAKTLAITVCDQGRGIPTEERSHLCGSFYQVNRVYFEQEGVGAGLARARHVAQLHGGEIVLESEPGQGSCFVLKLPVYK